MSEVDNVAPAVTDNATPTQESSATPVTPVTPVESWRDSLPEDIRSHASLQNVPDHATLAKNYVNQQELIGRKGIIPPTGPEDTEGFLRAVKALGRPEAATEYKIPEIKVDESVKSYFDPKNIEGFREIALDAGLNQVQFDKIVNGYTALQAGEIKGVLDNQASQRQVIEDGLRAQYKDEYDTISSKADKALEAFAKEMDPELLSAYKSDPNLKAIFANVAKSMSDDTIDLGKSTDVSAADSIKKQMEDMMGDRDGALRQYNHIDHESAVIEYKKLGEQLAKLQGN